MSARRRPEIRCTSDRRAPLRGRVKVVEAQPADQLPAGPFAREVLRVAAGDKVWVRKVFDPMQWETK